MFLNKFSIAIMELPRLRKQSVVLVLDSAMCLLAVWLSYYLRLGEFVALSGNDFWAIGASICLALPIFITFGLYQEIFRYSGWPALIAVVRAIGIYGLLYASIITAIGIQGVPRTIGIIQPILLLLFVGGSRALARIWLGDYYQRIFKHASRRKVLIYGAGATGRDLVKVISGSHEMQVVGFLDDDERLHGYMLNGLPIYNPANLASLASNITISEVLLAMPSINQKRRNEILNSIRSVHISVRTLPSMTDLVQGRISMSDIRDLDIDDLLGREPVMPNTILLEKNVRGKVVMVTGAGGSIGGELCRQILNLGPSKLLMVEQSEFALYRIHQELEKKLVCRDIALVPLLASVQDNERIREIITAWYPNTIYHAAAYKHVPLVEYNPAEGIKNNVLGTLRTAQAALENGVTDFVLISTDKAVRPTNIMGASKRLAEMVLQALAVSAAITKFSIVRFGNVLGTSGSVVPKFRQQIRDGGPVTLTHPEINRYFMTISEATQLVIQASAMAKGGDVFVLDMGQSIKIIDLARQMIELSGLTIKDEKNPSGDIEIRITGLRPGEKLYEELLIGNNPKPTQHSKIMKADEEFIPWLELEDKLRLLETALIVNDFSIIRLIMERLVSGYKPKDEIVDLVYLEQMATTKVSRLVD